MSSDPTSARYIPVEDYTPSPRYVPVQQSELSYYEVSRSLQDKILDLQGMKVVLVINNRRTEEFSRFHSLRANMDIYGSRAKEVEETTEVMMKFLNASKISPDVYFLNGLPPVKEVKSFGQISRAFSGFYETEVNVVSILRSILDESSKKLVIFLTHNDLRLNVDSFLRLLWSRDVSRTPMSFVFCTSYTHKMLWLKSFEKDIQNVSVSDDYLKEREGYKGFSYSHGDHIIRGLLGPFAPVMKQQRDEKWRCVVM